jgi:exopolyphosphatase/guanosine-5'-triphosphate,3'-diphosphate pyrophosphatase
MSDALAALDLGSNTFRLLLASPGPRGLDVSTRRAFQEIPRLSEGLVPGRPLGVEPLRRAWSALDAFQAEVAAAAPRRVLAGATMAARQASDGRSFLDEVGRRYGWETVLLSGGQEAFLSAAGVLSGLVPPLFEGIVFDVGGRSTEFALIEKGEVANVRSLDVGVVGLTESFISGAPARPDELAATARAVEERLKTLDWSVPRPGGRLVGTAGTVTTVAAMLLELENYDSEKTNNLVVSRQEVDRLLKALADETLERRRSRPGLHPRRADVIVAGLTEVSVIMDFFHADSLTVSDFSLLEGLWLAAAGLTPLEHTFTIKVRP